MLKMFEKGHSRLSSRRFPQLVCGSTARLRESDEIRGPMSEFSASYRIIL